jgi:hypothetical protein
MDQLHAWNVLVRVNRKKFVRQVAHHLMDRVCGIVVMILVAERHQNVAAVGKSANVISCTWF